MNDWQGKAWIVTQVVLTIGLWGTIVYLSLVSKDVPEILLAGGTTVLGFWFGSQVERRARSIGGGAG